MTADNAVATLMNLIRNYRNIPPDLIRDNIWIDFIHMNIHSNTPADDKGCIFCKKRILLNKPEGKHHLGLPALGEVSEKE